MGDESFGVDAVRPDGLAYVPGFVSIDEELRLLASIDAVPWLTSLKRRVQHYGYRYDYKARRVDASMYLGPLPQWGAELADRLVAQGLMPQRPDQMIINEYLPGQGISRHVDCIPCFGPVICSISLGCACEMVLRSNVGLRDFGMPAGAAPQILEHTLEARSALVLGGDARYRWSHEIPGRLKDRLPDGSVRLRVRRVSLTFRTVVQTGLPGG